MDFSQKIFHIEKIGGIELALHLSWNDIFNWLFLIASTSALVVAIALQIVQSIKNRGKNSPPKTMAEKSAKNR